MFRNGSRRKVAQQIRARATELVAAGLLTPEWVDPKHALEVQELDRELERLPERDAALPNELIDDLEAQEAPVLPLDDQYVRVQHLLAKARRDVLVLQLQGETLESNVGGALPVTDQKVVRKKLSAVEEELDVAVGKVRELEQWLIRYCSDLVRAQRGGKDPSAPRLRQEEAQRMSLRYLDRDGSDAPAGARGRSRTGPTGATIRSADLGVAAVRPS